jgi:PBP1b-binding outer membrane lipoprotein LpoB
MKRLISAAAIATAAIASGCATYDTPYQTKADAALNPTVTVAEGDNGALPYRQQSMFFKDRGLHQEVPSALTPKIIVAPPVQPG